jgi:precorrin-3B methylase
MTPAEALADMPQAVRVGAHVYDIRVVELVTGDPDARAQVDLEKQVIEITDCHASASSIASSVIHEILHIIWSDWNLPKRCEEERAVLAYEPGLAMLFANNPMLIMWLKKCLKK